MIFYEKEYNNFYAIGGLVEGLPTKAGPAKCLLNCVEKQFRQMAGEGDVASENTAKSK